MHDLIRPRVEAVAAKFPNAVLDDGRRVDACGASLGYCNRYPTSARFGFVVEHDDAFEHLIVRYELRMHPTFIKYEPHDKLTLEMNKLAVTECGPWVEQRLLDFLRDYLRLDRGDESLDVDLVLDPVCGMRFPRSAAAAEECYRGHPYFFCTAECHEQFAQEPGRFIWFKT
jgi:YHS domain-containing protein